MSLDAAEIDLSHAFEYGQGYVALSRVRSLRGLVLKGFNQNALVVHPAVRDIDGVFRQKSQYLEEYVDGKSQDYINQSHIKFIKKVGGSIERVSDEECNSKKSAMTTYEKTQMLLEETLGIADIARKREISTVTVVNHVRQLLQTRKITVDDISHLRPDSSDKQFEETLEVMQLLYNQTQTDTLKPIKEKFPDVSYENLHVYRLFIERE